MSSYSLVRLVQLSTCPCVVVLSFVVLFIVVHVSSYVLLTFRSPSWSIVRSVSVFWSSSSYSLGVCLCLSLLVAGCVKMSRSFPGFASPSSSCCRCCCCSYCNCCSCCYCCCCSSLLLLPPPPRRLPSSCFPSPSSFNLLSADLPVFFVASAKKGKQEKLI